MFIRRNGCIASTLLLAVLSLAGAIATSAQNIPPTARAAAASPQFASRLAHRAPLRRESQRKTCRCVPLTPKGSTKMITRRRALLERPNQRHTDRLAINSGFAMSDSFPGGGTATGSHFRSVVAPGDALQSAEISITSSEFGGTTYLDRPSTSRRRLRFESVWYNVCTETGTINDTGLPSGTYWVNVQNARLDTGIRFIGTKIPGHRWLRTTRLGQYPQSHSQLPAASKFIRHVCPSSKAGSRLFMISAAKQTEETLKGWPSTAQITFTEPQAIPFFPLARSTNWRKPAKPGC